MKHAMAKSRGGLKTRIAIAGLSLALPCSVLSELPSSPTAMKPVDYPYVLTAAISQTSTTVGISAFDLSTSTPEKVNATLDLLQGLGVTDIRISVPWNQIESYRGGFDFTQLDTVVNAAAARNMGVVGILEKTPAWAVRPGQPAVAGPPRSPEFLAQFASVVATRYAGKISAYELYNEPNLALAFSTLSPADYTAMLKAVYPAIKAADPDALVIGGVVGSTPEINFLTLGPDTFVKGMYAAGAQGYFDALSFHPYNWGLRFSQSGDIANASLYQLTLIRQLMVANGDTAKQIWVTEYGVPSATNGEGQQAVMLADMLNTWKTLDYAGPVFIHTAIDKATGSTVPEDTFGIFNSDYTAKLAAAIIQQAIAGTLPVTNTPVATEQAAITSALFINSLAATWNAVTGIFKPFVDAFNALVSSVLEAITPKLPSAAPVATVAAAASRSSAQSIAAPVSEPPKVAAGAGTQPGELASAKKIVDPDAGAVVQTSQQLASKAPIPSIVKVTGEVKVPETKTPSKESTGDEGVTTEAATTAAGATTGSTTTGSTTTGSTTTGSTTTGSTTTGTGGATTTGTGGTTTAGGTVAHETTAGGTTAGGTTAGGTTAGGAATGGTAGSTGAASAAG